MGIAAHNEVFISPSVAINNKDSNSNNNNRDDDNDEDSGFSIVMDFNTLENFSNDLVATPRKNSKFMSWWW